MLGVIAFGLIVYGAFMFAIAHYRRMGRAVRPVPHASA